MYGTVEYSRKVYRTVNEEGQAAHVFLLDKSMHMDKIGLVSTNLAEKIALTVTESPYRVTSEIISSTCGQDISAGGCRPDGRTKNIPVLFEKMDGVWLHMQNEKNKKMKKQEMKVFTMYEGWDAEKERQKRSTLVGKTMLAGMENSTGFHAKREACIRKKYDADEIGQRILNGDGGSWIKEPYDPETIFQLDRYHIYQEILRKISDKKAQTDIRSLFDEEKMDEMLEYIQTYATNIKSPEKADKSSKKAMELYQYLSNNKEGLLPYNKRGITIPEPEEELCIRVWGYRKARTVR